MRKIRKDELYDVSIGRARAIAKMIVNGECAFVVRQGHYEAEIVRDVCRGYQQSKYVYTVFDLNTGQRLATGYQNEFPRSLDEAEKVINALTSYSSSHGRTRFSA